MAEEFFGTPHAATYIWFVYSEDGISGFHSTFTLLLSVLVQTLPAQRLVLFPIRLDNEVFNILACVHTCREMMCFSLSRKEGIVSQ